MERTHILFVCHGRRQNACSCRASTHLFAANRGRRHIFYYRFTTTEASQGLLRQNMYNVQGWAVIRQVSPLFFRGFQKHDSLVLMDLPDTRRSPWQRMPSDLRLQRKSMVVSSLQTVRRRAASWHHQGSEPRQGKLAADLWQIPQQ